MLPQKHRLRRSADLRRIRQQGQVWRHPLAILIVQKNGLELSRFAFMASRRVGNSVSRNRAKRLLREAIRCHLGEIKSGWDLVFVARRKTPEVSFITMESAMLSLLDRANLVDGASKADKHICGGSA